MFLLSVQRFGIRKLNKSSSISLSLSLSFSRSLCMCACQLNMCVLTRWQWEVRTMGLFHLYGMSHTWRSTRPHLAPTQFNFGWCTSLSLSFLVPHLSLDLVVVIISKSLLTKTIHNWMVIASASNSTRSSNGGEGIRSPISGIILGTSC